MPRDTPEDWETIVARTGVVPQALDGLIASLREGVREGLVAAQRQAGACARQADTWGGVDGTARPYFLGLLDEYDQSSHTDAALRRRFEEVATRATESYVARTLPRR